MEFKQVCRSLVIAVCVFFVTNIFVIEAVTLLTVPQGGTGAGTFTAGGILQGDGTGVIQSNIMSGDGTLSASGVLTVSMDAVETITVEGKAAEDIDIGEAVYISGAVGNNVQFSLADNTVANKTNVAGVAIESKTSGQTIRVRHVGQLDNFDTSAWVDGDDLYLSTAGSLINTVPTSGTTLHVAYVEYSHATLGDILLHVCGEKNIGAPADTDLFIRMGDNAGTNKLSYKDYANNEVGYVNSDGDLSFNSLALVVDLDISDDTNLTAGRSLTLTDDNVFADSELYKTKAKIALEDPIATDDFFFEELATATTFSSIYCKTLVGTVTLDVSIAGSDINGVDIVCDTDGELDSSLGGDTTGAIGDELALVITSVASDPTYLFLQVNGTYDD